MMGSRTPGRPALTQRQRLGRRLKTLRELAGIRNEDMAKALGVSPATVSRMEDGTRIIKVTEIDAWVRAAGASAAAREDLAQLAEAAANQTHSWKTRLKDGVDQSQKETGDLQATARTILNFEHSAIPGLLQTRDYAEHTFRLADVGTGDIPGKVAGRIQRQGLLLDQSKSFVFLMSEAAVRWRPGTAEGHVAQLHQITAVMALPNVTIGVLPLDVRATAIYPEGFVILADRLDDAEPIVSVELIVEEYQISDPEHVELYLREFERLRAGALYGDDAKVFLDRLAQSLR
jgi:transcriptional regulator with XRE-family HTH domain